MRGIALDRLDEVRDEVAAALELDVDVRPSGSHLVSEPDEPVVPDDDEHEEDRDDAESDPQPEHRRECSQALVIAVPLESPSRKRFGLSSALQL